MPDPSNHPDFHPRFDQWAAAFTDLSFRKQRWQDQPALVSKDGNSMRSMEPGETFNPEIWDLNPVGWDHEHCSLCKVHICSHPNCGFQEAYLNHSGAWICPPCFELYFRHRLPAAEPE